ncbi:hypothetical protein HBH70_065050 [Parastagonospora nodorum]|nr:hypothetical protein HBH53_174490 [Parastagonospora nodorum]KAH4102135.1 hypothetical protein HBH46_129090 [Parastagonospora nodorum]KAH4165215.1 hypothetical protein HBH43_141760 [Parastagonospora nodorum]KAH4268116.1 hypothetical protein HBI03_057320 [Parastagonospora nodorum]KAH4278991.1 hypothetical protein HBI04_072770 [Parastagonospora nodorum]
MRADVLPHISRIKVSWHQVLSMPKPTYELKHCVSYTTWQVFAVMTDFRTPGMGLHCLCLQACHFLGATCSYSVDWFQLRDLETHLQLATRGYTSIENISTALWHAKRVLSTTLKISGCLLQNIT